LDRTSLALSVVNLVSAAERLAWLGDHLNELDGSGIIYALTVDGTLEVADYLRRHGHKVAAYSGRTEPAEREAAETSLLENKVKALVATSALGMGFDKGDLGFVIHLGAPPSPIAYYQQVGRAGRATEHADVVLLPGAEDTAIWDYFANQAFPGPNVVLAILDALPRGDAQGTGAMSTPALETLIDLSRSRLEATLKVLDVEGAVKRVQGGWVGTHEPWSYDTARYRRVAEVRKAERELMLGYERTTRCRMRYLLAALDDPFMAADCGRCDNCTGRAFTHEVHTDSLESARAELSRPGAPIEAHKMWPSNMSALGVELTGRIAASEASEPGRSVARFTDLGWGREVRAATDALAGDAPVPAELVRAAVTVLTDWKRSWPERPAAVISVGSQHHPQLVESFAKAIATVGKLPYLGAVSHHGPSRPLTRTNSAQRLAALWGNFALPESIQAVLAGPVAGRAVFLIDDVADSGWTLTVVGVLLRRAGAGAVYPLTLGIAA
jgi:ATP-dependent DNA helicase RecQ